MQVNVATNKTVTVVEPNYTNLGVRLGAWYQDEAGDKYFLTSAEEDQLIITAPDYTREKHITDKLIQLGHTVVGNVITACPDRADKWGAISLFDHAIAELHADNMAAVATLSK